VAEPEIMDMGGRSKEIMDRGAGAKSFNHKIIECILFVWIFAPWMDSSKDKMQIRVILLSRSHKKYITKLLLYHSNIDY
jgi:hypothetical protein